MAASSAARAERRTLALRKRSDRATIFADVEGCAGRTAAIAGQEIGPPVTSSRRVRGTRCRPPITTAGMPSAPSVSTNRLTRASVVARPSCMTIGACDTVNRSGAFWPAGVPSPCSFAIERIHEECGRRRSPGPNGRNGVMDTKRSSRRCSHPRPSHMTISRQSSREAAQRHTRESPPGSNFTPPLSRHREHRREEHRAHRQERLRPSPEAVSSTRCSPRCSHRPSHPPYRAQSLPLRRGDRPTNHHCGGDGRDDPSAARRCHRRRACPLLERRGRAVQDRGARHGDRARGPATSSALIVGNSAARPIDAGRSGDCGSVAGPLTTKGRRRCRAGPARQHRPVPTGRSRRTVPPRHRPRR